MTNVGKPRIPQMKLKLNSFKVAEFTLSKNLNTFPVTLSHDDVISSNFLVAFGTDLKLFSVLCHQLLLWLRV